MGEGAGGGGEAGGWDEDGRGLYYVRNRDVTSAEALSKILQPHLLLLIANVASPLQPLANMEALVVQGGGSRDGGGGGFCGTSKLCDVTFQCHADTAVARGT